MERRINNMGKMEYAGSLERLIRIMDELRTQCPWDKKQTIHTLRQLTIEEVYELADSISDNNWKGLKEELGDILLHIIFYSKIGAEQEEFDIHDVIEGVCNKLINRHPHIYSNVQVENDEQVKQNWEQIKLKEGKMSILAGVPASLPAIVKALRLQEKTKTVGFEWDHIGQVKEKVEEEVTELYDAMGKGNKREIEEEFGDVLFALVNYARFANIDPEHALELTNKKFIKRFQYIETAAKEQGKALDKMSLEEMDALWNEAKKH